MSASSQSGKRWFLILAEIEEEQPAAGLPENHHIETAPENIMKIIIDSRWLFLNPEGTGINNWTYNFIEVLSKHLKSHRLVQFFNVTRSRYSERINKATVPGVEKKVLRIPTRLVDRLLVDMNIPIELLLGKHDIFHGVRYFVPAAIKAKTVLNIYDMYHVRVPHALHPDWQYFLDHHLKRVAHRADKIVTISEASKSDIVNYLNVHEDKVVNVGAAIDHERFIPVSQDDASVIVKKYIPDSRPYILYVGLLAPWKNITTLIRAFEILKDETGCPHVLLLAGKSDYGSEEVIAETNGSRYKGDIRLPGYVESADLPALYSAAECFVFPSLWEGFGLPLVEAMGCGTPVLAGSVASNPFIVGDGGILFDPKSAEAMTEALNRVLFDGEIKAKLEAAAVIQAKKFQWKNVVDGIVDVYNNLAG